MPLLLGIIGLFAPRFVIALLWLFSGWFTGVFETRAWPILGFLFMPFTLLWYSIVMQWFGGTWGGGALIGLVVAVLLDFGVIGKSAARR